MKSTLVVQKKRGRPKTRKGEYDPVTAIRLSRDFRARMDAWAARQDDKPERSEAIRRLVERGLAGEPIGKSRRATKRKEGHDRGTRRKPRPRPTKTGIASSS